MTQEKYNFNEIKKDRISEKDWILFKNAQSRRLNHEFQFTLSVFCI